MLPPLGPYEGYHYRSHHSESAIPRYTVAMSAPPPPLPVRGKDGYVTLPPIRPVRPLLPPLGALLPVPNDRIYPASYPPASNYPISPYYTNASHAVWRAGLSYATAANMYAHARSAEEHNARVGSYDYRDYIVHEEDEAAAAAAALNGVAMAHEEMKASAPVMQQSASQDEDAARSASFDDSPPSFEGAQRATSSEESFEALQADARELASLPHFRSATVTQDDITGLRKATMPEQQATGLTAADPYHWHMPLVSGVDYFAGHSRAISAERSTTTPLIAQLTPANEEPPSAQIAEKMSLKTLLAPPDETAEEAIFDEKDFHMSLTD